LIELPTLLVGQLPEDGLEQPQELDLQGALERIRGPRRTADEATDTPTGPPEPAAPDIGAPAPAAVVAGAEVPT